MSGAAVSGQAVEALAIAMAPTVAETIPAEDLDEVYTLVLARMMLDPNQKPVMATARDFFAAWYELQAGREAEKAASIEQGMRDYRAREEARLRANPPKLIHIAALAERDNITLPWQVGRDAPGATERGQEARFRGGVYPDTTGRNQRPQETAQEVAEHLERVARNKEAWYRLGAESMRSTVDSAESSDSAEGAPQEDTHSGRTSRSSPASGAGHTRGKKKAR